MGSFHTRVVKVVEFQEELLTLRVKVNYLIKKEQFWAFMISIWSKTNYGIPSLGG